MRTRYKCILSPLALLALAAVSARADVPRTIAFQATLKDATGKPVSASRSVTFTLYDAATAGNAVWTETKDISPDATGLFATALGSVTPLTIVTFDKAYWVGVKVAGDANEMAPRLPLQSVPYALSMPGLVALGKEIGINGVPDSALTVQPSQEIDWISFKDKTGVTRWHINNMGGFNLAESGVADYRLFLAPGGNVGIGTAAPRFTLDVAGTAVTGEFRLRYDDPGVQTGFLLRGLSPNPSGATNGWQILGRPSYESGSGSVPDLPLLQWDNPYPSSTGNLLLMPAGGNVGIGTTSPYAKLHVNGGAIVQTLQCVAGAQAQTLTLTSSRRFKQGIQPIKNALGTIERLHGVKYQWDKNHGGRKDLGFVAEDVEKVVPELVTMEPDGKAAIGMDYSHLTALTVEAIKQLKTDNDTLRAQNKALAARLDRLERATKNASHKETHR